jgi:hypothetical protein
MGRRHGDFPAQPFRDRFYDPGLFAKHLGLHRESLLKLDASQQSGDLAVDGT